jgi:hypothetical protein
MSRLNLRPQKKASQGPVMVRLQRAPQRITITLNWALHQRLLDRSDYEGRSLSNLAAYLLEAACPET